jgi:hypothetical protein
MLYGNIPIPAAFTPDHEAYKSLSNSSPLEFGAFMNADVTPAIPGGSGTVSTSAVRYSGYCQVPWQL